MTENKDELKETKETNSEKASKKDLDNFLNKIDEKIEELEKEENKKNKKEANKCKKLENEILALKEALNLSNEKALRANAEMMNFKRRKEEETSNMLKYANEDVLKSLLPVVDNFERGIKLDDNDLSDEVSKFLSGFKMIYTNVIEILNKFDVSEIPAEGLEFDPNVHQAVLMEHDESKPHGVILEVLQKGYKYKDRVLRPAMVKVNE